LLSVHEGLAFSIEQQIASMCRVRLGVNPLRVIAAFGNAIQKQA
jgi:hypothetical protein